MKIKTSTALFMMMVFCLSAFGLPIKAAAVTLDEITSSVRSAENSVSDITIDYTNIVRPYGSKDRNLSAKEELLQRLGSFVLKGFELRTYDFPNTVRVDGRQPHREGPKKNHKMISVSTI